MARNSTRRPRKKSSGRRPKAKKRGFVAIAFERIKTLVTTVTLLATGALIGSWWIEWRDADAPDQQAVEAQVTDPSTRLKIEVLNGSGERGAAGVIGDILMGFGHDVVMVDNADHFDYDVSHVLDRAGLGQPIRELSRQLGADSVAVAVDPDLLLDATVILGKDWRSLTRDD